MQTLNPVVALTALLAASALSSACVSKTKTPDPLVLEERKVVLKEGEYEYGTITGSNLPVVKPKGGAPVQPIGGPPVATMSPEALHDLIRRSQSGRR
jgi:hypothetical protein